jgi:hypothetical protein
MNAVRDELCVPRNKHRKAVIFILAALTLSVARPAQATSFTIDFENLPSLPAQPDNFAAAGAMHTYNAPGMFTISGGVVLGDPTFLPAFPANGSPPNLYGTTDIADPSLLSIITLTFPSAENVVSVTGVVFNGQPIQENYEVDAFSGSVPVDSPLEILIDENTSAIGFGNFSLGSNAANPITSLTITPPNTSLNGWDFFVDTIGVDVAVLAPIPEPGSGLVFLTATLGFLVVVRWRRLRAGSAKELR